MILFQVINEGEPDNQPDLIIKEEWIEQISKGGEKAFENLYRSTRQAVFSYALSILKNPQDAEDVMQDTYMKIRSAAGQYKSQGKPLAWILTIVRNLSLMDLRQKKKGCPYLPEDADQQGEEAYFQRISDPEDRIVLKAALKILKEDERNILLLHAVSGIKHREIADATGIPVSTVLSKYRRALKKLKTYLIEQEGMESWQIK